MAIYLDYAATAPLREEAREAWLAAADAVNPGGQYASGRRARGILDDAAEAVAAALGCEPIEVIFTGSGTEADNLAVTGLYRARLAAGAADRIISTPIEHPAVARTVAATGARVDELPVGRDGVVRPELERALAADGAALATCMWANNETGAIQPVAALAAQASAAGVPFHVDAVQAVGHVPVNFGELGATTLAASAHKFGGPRGVGLLLARRSPAPQAVLHGGGQQRGLRSGTIDVAGAAATAAALVASCAEMREEGRREARLRDLLLRGIVERIPDAIVMTPRGDAALPGHVHVAFPGAEGDSLNMLLDARGIECATGSACASGVNRASDVLLAMGVPEADARGALRFTLGRGTSESDVSQVLTELPDVVRLARGAGMA